MASLDHFLIVALLKRPAGTCRGTTGGHRVAEDSSGLYSREASLLRCRHACMQLSDLRRTCALASGSPETGVRCKALQGTSGWQLISAGVDPDFLPERGACDRTESLMAETLLLSSPRRYYLANAWLDLKRNGVNKYDAVSFVKVRAAPGMETVGEFESVDSADIRR